MKKINIKAATQLVKHYREITEEDIETIYQRKFLKYGEKFKAIAPNIANELTGYINCPRGCPLCIATDVTGENRRNCSLCIYDKSIKTKNKILNETLFCCQDDNKSTFNAIFYASSSAELVQAFKERANHIEKILNNLKNK